MPQTIPSNMTKKNLSALREGLEDVSGARPLGDILFELPDALELTRLLLHARWEMLQKVLDGGMERARLVGSLISFLEELQDAFVVYTLVLNFAQSSSVLPEENWIKQVEDDRRTIQERMTEIESILCKISTAQPRITPELLQEKLAGKSEGKYVSLEELGKEYLPSAPE